MDKFLPNEEFLNTFSPEVAKALIDPVGRAYETALEGKMPEERGYNEQMFGFNLFGYCEHELLKEIVSFGRPFVKLKRGKTFRFQVGPYEIGCYRAGRSNRESIWSSFPDNDNGIQSLANNPQMFLPGMDPQETPKLVLAHMGNSEEGLCSIYLCAPKNWKDGKICEWGFVHELWRKADEGAAEVAPATPAPQVPAEEVKRPQLRRKRPLDPGAEHG